MTTARMHAAHAAHAAALALALSAAPALLHAQYPTQPPPAGPIEPAVFPPFQEARLPNGLQLVVVENHEQPIVSISLSLPAGDAYDAAGKEGLADMVAGLLTKGAGTRTADQIAETIEGVGGSLSASAGRDFLTVDAGVLTPDAPLAFSMLADVVMRPTFPAAEVELARTQALSGLELQLSQPASIASRVFAERLYGAHPYARSATPASVRSLTRDDLVRFQRSRLRPGGALLVVAGDLPFAEARRLATAAFAGWTGAVPAAAAFPAPPARKATEIVLVHRPGSVQSNIVVGNTTFGPADDRRYAATVANQVLGAAADSRLFMTLREQKSWTYGAYSQLTRPRDVGAFRASTEVRTAVTDSAATELFAQLRRITSEPVSPVELAAARGALVGSFPLSIQTAEQIAGAVAQQKLLGLPADYLKTYRTRLAAVTADQARAGARAMVRPDQALMVVVGDGAALYDKLAAIAPVRVITPQGDALAPGDLTARAATGTLDPRRMVARRDSFAIVVQGNPVGFQRSVIEKDGDGWKLTDDSQLATVISQRTTVTMDGQLRTTRVLQTGMVQGKESSIDVTFANGRAKGSATTPTPPTGELKSVTIDTLVPANAVDDNASMAITPTMPWGPGATFTVPIFGSGDGELRTVTMAVTATEQVTVPAGAFEAYRVQVTGGKQNATMWVTTAAPNRVVRIVPDGVPIEIVLVK